MMALTDEVVLLALGFLVNYVLLYRNNKFLGSLAFFALSAILLSYSTDTLVAGTGIVLISISLISIVYNLLPKNIKNKGLKNAYR